MIKPGFQDLVQDLGRDGYTHLGISPTGAADKASMKIANLLLGYSVNDPVIEITLFGGSYSFDCTTTICFAGSHFPASIKGKEIPFLKPVLVDIDLNNAIKTLDEDHFGLEKVKDRIIEFLAVQKKWV